MWLTRRHAFEARLTKIFDALHGRYPAIMTIEAGLDAAAVERDAYIKTLAVIAKNEKEVEASVLARAAIFTFCPDETMHPKP
jgi:hypothetical protein